MGYKKKLDLETSNEKTLMGGVNEFLSTIDRR
jgi:hypothetical protein